jgi:hypothetical protein
MLLNLNRFIKWPITAWFFLVFFHTVVTNADDKSDPDIDPWVEKAFVIIKSTKSFTEANTIATEAATWLGLNLNFRGLSESKKIGLTFSRSICNEDGFSYPCYLARGRWDDSAYVSIEYSNAYRGFRKGYYIVVVASGYPNDSVVSDVLEKARKTYKDAYLKITKVYIGCIH